MKKRIAKAALWSSGLTVLAANILAYNQASRSMRYRKKPSKLNQFVAADKVQLVLGQEHLRPENDQKPSQEFEEVIIKGNRGNLEGWYIPVANAKGTVLIFHGYTRNKAYMLNKSDALVEMGYNTFLIDFIGSGGSEGVQTTIGYHEAEDVKTAFEFMQQRNSEKRNKEEQNSEEQNSEGDASPIYLFGSSMGAVAIMKAIYDYDIQPDAILIECPFASMYQAVANRFKLANMPRFPLAPLLVFWGGAQNKFWAFGHNPTEYAAKVQCPTLLMYGAKDEKVDRAEIDAIYTNLNDPKYLHVFEEAGHSDYFDKHSQDWRNVVHAFLDAQILAQ
jgi:alpha-beta hydrolase superfamily lysophospholipase